jgi:hypothetical protein
MRGLALVGVLCLMLGACASGVPAASPRSSASAPAASAPAASPVPETVGTTPVPSVAPSGRPPSAAVVAYEDDGGIWVVNADGTDARRLTPRGQGRQAPIAWSRDGSTLVYRRDTPMGLGLTDANGSGPELIDLRCPDDPAADPLLVACQPVADSVAISPDGSKLAYAVWEGSHDQSRKDVSNTIVVLDRRTADIATLESTRVPLPTGACVTDGVHRSAQWSPDGSRLLIVSSDPACGLPTQTVSVDGTGLREVEIPRRGMQAAWAPDGSLVFIPAGSRLTRDGRVVGVRFPDGKQLGDLWISDADGGNATMLTPTVPALTAAGCVICPYPVYPDGDQAVIDPLVVRRTPPYERFWITELLWQPAP